MALSEEELLDLFFARSEMALLELDRAYGKQCHSLSYQILHSSRDAEECVNDAYLGFWNTVPPNRPSPVQTFLYKIVRNVSIARYHRNLAQKRNSAYDVSLSEIEPCITSPNGVEEQMNAKLLAEYLGSFLEAQSLENRVIFMRRYWFADAYADIAKQTGLSVKSVSVRLTRMRKQLKSYLMEQGVWG